MKKRNPSSRRGSACQSCGVFRAVGLNGRLPPHKCQPPATAFPTNQGRRIIVLQDDGCASAIRAICYGSA